MLDGVVFGYNNPSPSSSSGSARANSTANRVSRETANLEDRFERLSLVCMAMWSLLQDKAGLTEEELLERVHTLDMMDGVPDGKATTTVSKCRKCARTMAPRHRRCIYCGAPRPIGSAFDAV